MAKLRDVEERNQAYRAGQLHAAVAALQNVAGIGGRRLMSPGVVSLAAESPSKRIKEALFEVGQYLVKTAAGPGRAAAGEIFATLPELLRASGGLVDSLDVTAQEDFKEGCRDQLAFYREKYGSVVG